jgi:hypothetical protein
MNPDLSIATHFKPKQTKPNTIVAWQEWDSSGYLSNPGNQAYFLCQFIYTSRVLFDSPVATPQANSFIITIFQTGMGIALP